MEQLKARVQQRLYEKADKAAGVEGISKAELIRRAVNKEANNIISEFSNSNDNAPADICETDDDEKSETNSGYNYLKEHAQQVESLENLEEHMANVDAEYPVNPDADVDWTNKDIVGKSYTYRLPVLRGWIDEVATDRYDKHVPDAVLRSWISERLDVCRATMYSDLKRMKETGCAYPNFHIDPAWDEEALRQDLLDYICANSARSRDAAADNFDSVDDILTGTALSDDGKRKQIYGCVFADVWYSEEDDYRDHLVEQLELLVDIVAEYGPETEGFDVGRYRIVLERFMDYIKHDTPVDLSGHITAAERRLDSNYENEDANTSTAEQDVTG